MDVLPFWNLFPATAACSALLRQCHAHLYRSVTVVAASPMERRLSELNTKASRNQSFTRRVVLINKYKSSKAMI